MLILPNLQQPFEVETHVSGYPMRAILMQGGRPICYHYEVFHGAILNNLAYDKQLYALVQVVKKWKHYIMGKGNHHPYKSTTATIPTSLEYATSDQTLQVDGVLNIVSSSHKNKKGNTNKLDNMLSRLPTSKFTSLGTLMHMEPFTYDAYIGIYKGGGLQGCVLAISKLESFK